MKKLLSVLLSVIMAVSVFAGVNVSAVENSKLSSELTRALRLVNDDETIRVSIWFKGFSDSYLDEKVNENIRNNEELKKSDPQSIEYAQLIHQIRIDTLNKVFTEYNQKCIDEIFKDTEVSSIYVSHYTPNVEVEISKSDVLKLENCDKVVSVEYIKPLNVENCTQPVSDSKIYEERFKSWMTSDALAEGYEYEELYYHQDAEQHTDWVLVKARCNVPVPEVMCNMTIGNRYIEVSCQYPFECGYGVYSVYDDTFYDTKDLQDSDKFAGLEKAFDDLNIGIKIGGVEDLLNKKYKHTYLWNLTSLGKAGDYELYYNVTQYYTFMDVKLVFGKYLFDVFSQQSPDFVGLYLRKDDKVYNLSEADVQKLVDMDEVVNLINSRKDLRYNFTISLFEGGTNTDTTVEYEETYNNTIEQNTSVELPTISPSTTVLPTFVTYTEDETTKSQLSDNENALMLLREKYPDYIWCLNEVVDLGKMGNYTLYYNMPQYFTCIYYYAVIGDYSFEVIHQQQPYDMGVFVVGEGNVFTLKEAYSFGIVNMDNVVELLNKNTVWQNNFRIYKSSETTKVSTTDHTTATVSHTHTTVSSTQTNSESESTTIPTSEYTEPVTEVTVPVTENTQPVTTIPVAKTSITLNKSSASLYVKSTTKIKATVKNGKGATTYKSSNTKIANVDKNGKVTALKKGTAKITVINNNVSKTFTVTVKNPKLNKSSVSLKKGRSFTIKITGKVGKATFRTSNKKIATVNNSGKIVAKKKGSATITVKTNGITLKCKVKIV